MQVKKKEPKIRLFKTAAAWRAWLEKNHALDEGVWVRFFKKDSAVKSVSYAEALDEALCFGWIDGQAKSHDSTSWIQRFTPRRKKSLWSKRNREHVARLIKDKKMTPHGHAEIKRARVDGRWEGAYDSPAKMTIPADFLTELSKNKKAEQFFKTLSKANTYAIVWRLQTAVKPETRARRMLQIFAMLKEGKTFH